MAPFRPLAPSRVPDTSWLIAGAIILGCLYVGRDVLAPLALALLLTIAVLPLAEWMERQRVGRVASVLATLLLALLILGSMVYVVGTQAFLLLEELPRYESELRAKLKVLSDGSGPLESLISLVHRLAETMQPAGKPSLPSVIIGDPPEAPFYAIFGALKLFLGPAAIVAATLILMASLLLKREDVRDRVLRLAGTDDIHVSTRAMQDATDRVGRFLLMQLLVNGAFGICIGVGLAVIGVPNAPLWGMLGFALRFIPFLGMPLAALFPLTIAFATTQGWGSVLLTMLLFAAVDLILVNVIEPWLFGASTGVSSLALILSAIFWATLWGPMGLILSPAISACLVTLGRTLPQLEFLDVLLGDRAPLLPPEQFYQRLLAGDPATAATLARSQGQQDGVGEALRSLVQPSIERISRDRLLPNFDAALATQAARTLLRCLEILREEDSSVGEISVMGVAGALDQAAAAMATAALEDEGHAVTFGALSGHTQVMVLVIAGQPNEARMRRTWERALKAELPVVVFAPTEEGGAAIEGMVPKLPVVTTLLELSERLSTFHEPSV